MERDIFLTEWSENGRVAHFINERLRGCAGDPDALIVYPHAQRTGGVTMRKRVLAEVFGEDHVYNRHYVQNFKPWRKLSDADLAGYRAYTDLDDYKDIGLTRQCLYVAVLRDPVYRAASIYSWTRQKTDHGFHKMARSLALEEFYRAASKKSPGYFRNVQCTRICGEPNAGMALDVIREKYIAAGFTSHLSEFVRALCEAFRWPNLEIKDVEPDGQRYDATITQEFREHVLAESAEDAKLFAAMTAVVANPGAAFPSLPPPAPGTRLHSKGVRSLLASRVRAATGL